MASEWAPHFLPEDVKLLKEQDVYQGYSVMKQLEVQYPLFRGGMTPPLARELFFRKPAVAVLVLDDIADKVVLIEQARMGLVLSEENPWLLEIVAGVVDEGDTLEQTAYREVKEETGCEVLALIPVCTYWVSPGVSTEKIFIYCARVTAPVETEYHGLVEHGEDIKVQIFSTDEAFTLLKQGKIVSSPAIIALQWLQINRKSLIFPQ